MFALLLQLASERFGIFHADRIRWLFVEANEHHALSDRVPDRERAGKPGKVSTIRSLISGRRFKNRNEVCGDGEGDADFVTLSPSVHECHLKSRSIFSDGALA